MISPNHFLIGRPIPSLVFGDSEQIPEWEYQDDSEYPSLLAKTLEFRDSLFEQFRDRWVKEYLVNLREKDRACHHSPKSWEKDEIALFKLPSKARAFWPLVRIVETFPNEDGVVRTLRVVKPDGNTVTVNVSHLIPLELYSELNDPNLYNVQYDDNVLVEDLEIVDESSEIIEEPEPCSTRPSRKTAKASRDQIKSLASKGLV